jgi:hypothetical protein
MNWSFEIPFLASSLFFPHFFGATFVLDSLKEKG